MPETDANALPVSSSAPPEFSPEQRSMFVEVLSIFQANEIPFAVSGAFALHQHTGIWRDTKDLDLFLPREEMPRALSVLDAAGLTTEICDPVWLCKARRGEYFVDLITGMSNAVITVQQDWIDRATESEILGLQAKVLAAEELIASKLFVTRRERFDGADIAHVIHGTAGKLDWDRILRLADEHWMMVLWMLVLYQYVYPAQSHYVPRTLWHELISRLQNELEHHNSEAPFRGSLIDDKMFAIDVEEWDMENLNEKIRTERNRVA